MSDDRRYGLAIIAFIGSVFSPYYAWSGRADPMNHCALNVSLYGPRGKRWAMTERTRSAVHAASDSLSIGPSAVRWSGQSLVIDVDEITVPWPSRIRGRITVHPSILGGPRFEIDEAGRHSWCPLIPRSRIEVDLQHPDLSWAGNSYIDSNFGDQPLEDAFRCWNWARADCGQGAAVLYHTTALDGRPTSLAQQCDRTGAWQAFQPACAVDLPRTPWQIARRTYADRPDVQVLRTFEDGPFYARSLLSTELAGQTTLAIHESVSLERFSKGWVKAMLPFRMPRAVL